LRELKQQIQSAKKEMRKLGVDTEKAKEELLAVTEPIYLAQY
jgi:L-rhamnose isomerase